jgi:hypothetical protein
VNIPGQGYLGHKGIKGAYSDAMAHRNLVIESIKIPHPDIGREPTTSLHNIALPPLNTVCWILYALMDNVRKYKTLQILAQLA